jgi:hypothetical protein
MAKHKRWNVDHQPHVIRYDQRAVMPGESYEFTTEQIKAGLAGQWSEEDPRAGLDAEKKFKQKRDEKVAPTIDTPAESGEKE